MDILSNNIVFLVIFVYSKSFYIILVNTPTVMVDKYLSGGHKVLVDRYVHLQPSV